LLGVDGLHRNIH